MQSLQRTACRRRLRTRLAGTPAILHLPAADLSSDDDGDGDCEQARDDYLDFIRARDPSSPSPLSLRCTLDAPTTEPGPAAALDPLDSSVCSPSSSSSLSSSSAGPRTPSCAVAPPRVGRSLFADELLGKPIVLEGPAPSAGGAVLRLHTRVRRSSSAPSITTEFRVAPQPPGACPCACTLL
eukprot:m51a1_g8627 hypothetical protein (182) ;mRNA; r:98137-98682